MTRRCNALVTGLLLLALYAGAAVSSAALGAAGAIPAQAAPPATTEALSNDEVVVATLDPSGLPEKARLISRLTSNGGPVREVADPSSVTNVRYLDRLGRPATSHDSVLVQVGGPGVRTTLTEARFDRPLPVAVQAQYQLGGKAVAPDSVLGSDAKVSVTYTITNTTARTETLRYVDGAGARHTEKQPVFAPFTGTMVVTLAPDVEIISAPRAVRMANASGATQLQWNLVLYPPLTSPQQVAKLVMRAPRAGLPAVSIRLSPAGSTADPAAKFALALLKSSNTGNAHLYTGLRELDRGAGSLATGSSELAAGLSQLAAGTSRAASGSGRLAGGLSDLATGVAKLAAGNAKLARALDKAATGAEQLAKASKTLATADTSASVNALTQLQSASSQLTASASTLAGRLGRATDPQLPDPLPSPDADSVCDLDTDDDGKPDKEYDDDCVTVYQGLRALSAGLHSAALAASALVTNLDTASTAATEVSTGIAAAGELSGTAAVGATQLVGEVCQLPATVLTPQQCELLGQVASSASAAAQTVAATVDPLTKVLTAVGTAQAYGRVLAQAVNDSAAACDRLLSGIDALAAGMSSGDPNRPGLVEGLNSMTAGLGSLASGMQASFGQLGTALSGLAAGNAQLATGVAQAAKGGEALAAGAGQLATGGTRAAGSAQQLATGIDQLATGAGQAAAGAADLAAGAQSLHKNGTSQMADAVRTASQDPAMVRSWLAAAGARAADALPYGPPEGATGHVVYLFDLPAQQAPAESLWQRIRGWFD